MDKMNRGRFRIREPFVWLMMLVIFQVSTLRSEESEESLETTAESEWEVRTERRHWHAAAFACSRGEGGVEGAGVGGGGGLAVPRSRAQAVAIGRLLASADPDPLMAFVGLSDLAEEGDFMTEDGEPLWKVGYARWHSWNFRGGKDDHCVAIDHFGLYWDVPCSWRLPFVCQRPPPPSPPPPTCAPIDGDASAAQGDAGDDGDDPKQETIAVPLTLESAPRNWWGAVASCARGGLRLALPTSRAQLGALRDQLIASTPPGQDDDPLWSLAFIGASDLARAGYRRTLLGEPFLEHIEQSTVTNEESDSEVVLLTTPATGEGSEEDEKEDPPEAAAGATCVAVNRMGEYEVARCSAQLLFFCEEPPPPPAPVVCPTPAPEAPELPPPPGHFWLGHSARMTWADAARACLDEGSVLAVPETAVEAQAMADLLRTVPRPSDEDLGSDIWGYVGAMNIQDPENEFYSRNFTTIFGGGLRWARWGPGQPNGEPGRQPCLALDRAATLWDVPCDWHMSFFCRRFPAEPPWTLPAARAGPGGGWRVRSQEMRRWLRNMRALGVGIAVPPQPAYEGETQPEMEAANIPSTARGFAHVDLRAWIESFRENSTFHFAPFIFDDRNSPSTILY